MNVLVIDFGGTHVKALGSMRNWLQAAAKPTPRTIGQ